MVQTLGEVQRKVDTKMEVFLRIFDRIEIY